MRFGFRMLLKRPGFTLVAILSLALGTGANTAIFSLVNMMLLRPLPIEQPEQLVSLNNTARSTFSTFSYPNYKDIRDRNDVFADVVAYRLTPLSMSHDGINERVWGYEVSGNYFEALGVKTALGRTILPDDDQLQTASPVAVMSYKCWQQRFGADPNVIGKEVIVNGSSYTIIGVTPKGFYGTEIISAPDLWFPIAMQERLENGRKWLDERGSENLFLQGRLKAGVSLAQAQAALDLISAQLEREYPDVNEGKRIILSPPGLFGTAMRGAVLGFAGLLMAVVGLVLLLACTNLANLLLARATERRREIAVRLAVGASRFRVVRQLLTESLLLALIGGALGLMPALWLVNLAMTIKVPPSIPLSFELQIDYRVYLFTFLLSLLTGVLFGLLPALQATKIDQISALKNEVSFVSGGRSRLKNGLIVLQVALSLVLLVGGGLMLRSLERASTIELGFETEHAAEISFDLRLQGYESERAKVFQKTLLERVRNLPGVQSVGMADMIPVDLHFSRNRVFVEGQTIERIKDAPVVMFNSASPGFFSAMKTRLVQGRDFTEQDDEKAPRVAIINEAFARRFFPGQNPIGKRFSLGDPDSAKVQIIGVVQDGKYAGLNENARSYVSLPLWQSGVGATSLVIRSDGDLPKLIAAVRREIEELDPHIPIA
ncbi:MAG TPA: ABC transporter permease, partial [Blastocatellia bacterium]|nr:ABC transporter permease [Blastocatellia bacterium]